MRETTTIFLQGTALLLLSTPVWSVEWADPTRPDTYHAPAASIAPNYTLSAIFTSGDQRIAVVNGHSLGVGDRLGAATLVRIDEDRVTLMLDGRSIVKKLKNGRPEK